MANKQKRKLSPAEKAVNVILVVVVVLVLGLSVWAVGPKVWNGVKSMLPQPPAPDTSVVSGMAESLEMTVDEFKAEYGLKDDVTGETLMSDVVGTLTLKNYAKLNEYEDYASFVEELGIADKVTEETLWSEAEPIIPFGNYIGGEEAFNQIKTAYSLDDSITMDTAWGEVKPVLEQKQAEMAAAQTEAAPEAETQTAE